MKELNGCDQNKGCKILWDHQGEPYFLDEGKVIFPSKKTSVKTFQYNKFDYVNTDLFHKDNKEFTFDKGHCFDG